MQKAEEVALQKNVFKIRLNTFEFQVPQFYERLGYIVFAIERVSQKVIKPTTFIKC